jgi:anti-sigma factor ChrR (cupin superfamily)
MRTPDTENSAINLKFYTENEVSVSTNKSLFIACLAVSGLFLTAPVSAEENINRSIDDFEWREIMPGFSISSVWEEDPNGDNALMVKISAGTTLPRHSHTGGYHGILVQGNWVHSNAKGEDFSLMPGSYVYQTGKVNHGDRCEGEVDCMILVHRHEAGDFIPEE